ncbi:MAG: hypothetical protein IPL11_13040, partial [Candidatus Accumulibacter sp.]|nr:hypothetical protein [Accumulibacter sp.]
MSNVLFSTAKPPARPMPKQSDFNASTRPSRRKPWDRSPAATAASSWSPTMSACGIVPMSALSRLFADEQGRLNQRVGGGAIEYAGSGSFGLLTLK